MKALIIEDEPLAAERLEELIRKVDPSIVVTGRCDSVKVAVKWLQENPLPHLLFLDIQLGDGLSFEIFDQVDIRCPVIFTTAFDSYAIEAFRLHSMAYLLKPVKLEELEKAIAKYKSSPYADSDAWARQHIAFDQVRHMLTREYKKRFLIKTGAHIKTVTTAEILYFFSLEKATFAALANGRTLLFDYTLEQLESLLDPESFFRINRKYIISLGAIADIISTSNYRLRLVLKNCDDQEILVSRERLQDFKSWLDK
jgi:two-component system, LytTR family, response regulator